MKKTMFAAAAVAMMSVFGVAQAAELDTTKEVGFARAPDPTIFSNMGVSAKVGTAGGGVDLTFPVSNTFKVRAGYSGYNYTDTVTKEGITYDGKLEVGGWSLLGDWHPSGGGFRFTGGIYSPKHAITGNAQATSGTITLDGTTYNIGSDIAGASMSSKWDKVSPYLGLGYDGFNSTKSGGFYFTADAGVILTGSPKVKLAADCLNPSICAAVADSITAEETKLNNNLKSIRAMPVVQLGVGYRF